MKANDSLMMKFLEGSKQFVIPLFQRTYSWGDPQLETLWNDAINTKNGEEEVHFFGSSYALVYRFLRSTLTMA